MTIATSPYFIDQEKAIGLVKRIVGELFHDHRPLHAGMNGADVIVGARFGEGEGKGLTFCKIVGAKCAIIGGDVVSGRVVIGPGNRGANLHGDAGGTKFKS